jgi:hypothetical protein
MSDPAAKTELFACKNQKSVLSFPNRRIGARLAGREAAMAEEEILISNLA